MRLQLHIMEQQKQLAMSNEQSRKGWTLKITPIFIS